MDTSLDKHTVLRLLRELDHQDAQRKVFGSHVHQYRLRPPLPKTVIEAFEKPNHVALPGDYKYFITEIGNGGAGPYYGLFPFGQHDDGHDLCAWDGGGLVGDFSKAFPHREAWNLPASFWQNQPDPPPDMPPDDEDGLREAWDRELEEKYWDPALMNGAIPICHLGCAYRQWLVINGEQRGYVWRDDRVDDKGISPLRDESGKQMTFADWYMSWLHGTLADA